MCTEIFNQNNFVDSKGKVYYFKSVTACSEYIKFASALINETLITSVFSALIFGYQKSRSLYGCQVITFFLSVLIE